VIRRPPTLDEVFRALADPTRRAILEQLRAGPVGTSTLAAQADMALPSFVQHLAILEHCGLIRSMKLGRIRMYRLVPKQLKGAHAWLTGQHRTR
jgi:DNA-binding transcriptional ArsR family regulator